MPNKNTPAMMDVFALIAAERTRQRELFAANKITFDVAAPLPDVNRKLRVVVEEIGEVAQEIDHLEQLKPNSKAAAAVRARLRTELVQVAAVCVAWLESFEVQP
jgi:hypothetical protein